MKLSKLREICFNPDSIEFYYRSRIDRAQGRIAFNLLSLADLRFMQHHS